MLKKILSYLYPIIIYQRKSTVSKNLEITWNNGQLVLDSKNTNYSFGSLQRILRLGLKKIGFSKIKSMENILILGVAGGSVIQTISKEIKFKGKITGVEIDPEIIDIAQTFFKLNEILNLEIKIDDAFEFVLKTKDRFDLIIIDVFQDTLMPHFLFENYFKDRLVFLLNQNGFILFNTMILSESENKRNLEYIRSYDKKNFDITILPRIEDHNEVLIIQKLIE